MSNLKDFMKNGWHPEKEGTTLKSQVSGLMGRHKAAPPPTNASHHASRPLSSLVDPSSFAPPPKRTASGLASAPASRSVVSAPARSNGPRASRPPALPPPPGRANDADGTSPLTRHHDAAAAAKPRPMLPSLPPRLPPRTEPHGPAKTTLDGHVNAGAVGRLGAVGVSVPGLGIGRSGPSDSQSPPAQPSPAGRFGIPVKGFQDGSSSLGSPSVSSSPAPHPSQGTTWAQKQAALKTASSFYKDPSSVTLTDAKATAGTVNNFRHHHGDQIQTGLARASDLNRKYDVANKLGVRVDRQSPAAELAAKKPPPPPPPKKKAGFGGPTSAQLADGGHDDAPPPIPMSTRPLF